MNAYLRYPPRAMPKLKNLQPGEKLRLDFTRREIRVRRTSDSDHYELVEEKVVAMYFQSPADAAEWAENNLGA